MPFGVYQPRRWRSQPQGAVEVDSRYGPAFAFNANGGSPRTATRPPLAAGRGGAFFNTELAFTSVDVQGAPDVSGNNGLSGLAIIRPVASNGEWLNTDSQRQLVSTRNAFNVGWSWGRSGASAGGNLGNLTRHLFTLQGVNDYTASTYTIPSFASTVVAFRFTGSSVEFFDDGGTGSPRSIETISTGTLFNGGGLVVFGQGEAGLSSWFGQVGMLALWGRALPSAQMLEFVRNPWGIFRPRRPIIYSLPSSTPVLSAATVIDIGSTSARPRVTITI